MLSGSNHSSSRPRRSASSTSEIRFRLLLFFLWLPDPSSDWYCAVYPRDRYNSPMHQSEDGSGNQRKNSNNRKRISDVLLAERLGLDEEWLDPDNIVHLPQSLPQTLPQGGGRKMSVAEVRDLEKYLDNMVTGGCHRSVLYWCLEQLGPKSDRARAGEVRIAVLHDD